MKDKKVISIKRLFWTGVASTFLILGFYFFVRGSIQMWHVFKGVKVNAEYLGSETKTKKIMVLQKIGSSKTKFTHETFYKVAYINPISGKREESIIDYYRDKMKDGNGYITIYYDRGKVFSLEGAQDKCRFGGIIILEVMGIVGIVKLRGKIQRKIGIGKNTKKK